MAQRSQEETAALYAQLADRKMCGLCQIEKEGRAFGIKTGKTRRDGTRSPILTSYCYPCMAARCRAYRADPRTARALALKHRKRRLERAEAYQESARRYETENYTAINQRRQARWHARALLRRTAQVPHVQEALLGVYGVTTWARIDRAFRMEARFVFIWTLHLLRFPIPEIATHAGIDRTSVYYYLTTVRNKTWRSHNPGFVFVLQEVRLALGKPHNKWAAPEQPQHAPVDWRDEAVG